MSYFTLDNQNLLNNDKQILSMTEHNNRGHHNQPHSEEAKKRISESQKARYKQLRMQAKRGRENPITEERVREITKGVIIEFIRSNTFHVPTDKNNNARPININL
jgi:hypothetical protein